MGITLETLITTLAMTLMISLVVRDPVMCREETNLSSNSQLISNRGIHINKTMAVMIQIFGNHPHHQSMESLLDKALWVVEVLLLVVHGVSNSNNHLVDMHNPSHNKEDHP